MSRWYHVCCSCEAKWFYLFQVCPCPRCGTENEAKEKMVPPWAGTSNPCDAKPRCSRRKELAMSVVIITIIVTIITSMIGV